MAVRRVSPVAGYALEHLIATGCCDANVDRLHNASKEKSISGMMLSTSRDKTPQLTLAGNASTTSCKSP